MAIAHEGDKPALGRKLGIKFGLFRIGQTLGAAIQPCEEQIAIERDQNGLAVGGPFVGHDALEIADPLAFESQVNQWPGVVTVGVFAHQKASVCLLGTASGVRTLTF